MRRHILKISVVLFCAPFFLFAQQSVPLTRTSADGCPGVPGACGYHAPSSTSSSSARSGPNITPQNGNGTLGNYWSLTKCGLNYTTASQRLGKRFTPAGVNQPAPFTISGIPVTPCIVIEKAILYCDASGNGAAMSATVNGPCGTASYPMTVVGNGPDKCWGYSGTYTYRADVTPSVCGNGTYNISGLLTNPPTAGNDVDGATLVVVWSDPSQTYQGTFRVDDGCIVMIGGTANYNMSFPAICGPTTAGSGFFCIGDIQFNPTSWSINGTACGLTWNWWNCISTNTTFNSGQTTCNYNVNSSGDCYNLCVAAAYWRTTCVACSASSITLSTTSTSANCSACNGSATVTVTPAGPYTYSWNTVPAQTTATATNLCAGTYTVTVTSSCGSSTAAVTVTTSGGSINVTNTSQTNVLCNGGCNGSVTVSASGGTAPYTFTWSPAVTNSTAGNNNTATGLCAGSYTVTATDATGCSGTLTVTITQPPPLVTTGAQTNVTCNGGCNGTATTTAAGGTSPYTYSWSCSAQTTATATNLCAGNCTCTVTDNHGCTITQTFSITQPLAISSTTSTTPTTCGNCNGTATVNPSGGTGAYTYSWNPTAQTTQTATGLCAGTYTCTVHDANNCSYTVAVTVANTAGPVATLVSFTNVTCFGACNGTATASVTGGTGPYTYTWQNSGGNTLNATGLCPGTYTFTATDFNSCTSSFTITITQPTQLTATSSQTNVTCNAACNGSATVNASGGVPPYTYSWSCTAQTSSTVNNICAGNCTCTITDANGCFITQTFTITEPPALTLAIAGFNVTCNGACDGQVVVIPSGGTGNYTFSWNTGCNQPSCNNVCAGSYTVTVNDANGCTAIDSTTVTQPPAISISLTEVDAHCGQADGSATATATGGTGNLTYTWSNGPTGQNDNNIIPGYYVVTVHDQNGCTDTAGVYVNNIPGVTTSVTSVTNVSCFGACDGSITCAAPTTGTPPYTYSWSPNGGNGLTASNLCPATYTLTVTDSAGCSTTATATITQPTQLTVTASANPAAICVGQNSQITATGAGGTPTYTYLWNPGAMLGQTQNVSPAATTTYTVYITDNHNCIDSTTVTVTVNAVPVAMLVGDTLTGCAPHCVNFTDMSTTANGNIISWAWNFGDGNTSTAQNPSHCYTVPGTYTVTLTVTTSGGCSNTITMPNYIEIYSVPVADFSASPQPASELDPTITFTDLSVGAFTWFWDFGNYPDVTSTVQNPVFNYDTAGCYNVVLTVTSDHGCVDTAMHLICINPDVTIFVPNAFTPNGDGVNDYFFPKGIGLDPSHFEMWIFDRWGNMIFYTDDLNKGWDGKVQGHENFCQQDVYVWKIRCVDVLGTKHNIIGHVSLIR